MPEALPLVPELEPSFEPACPPAPFAVDSLPAPPLPVALEASALDPDVAAPSFEPSAPSSDASKREPPHAAGAIRKDSAAAPKTPSALAA
jgi:hypothetical protein